MYTTLCVSLFILVAYAVGITVEYISLCKHYKAVKTELKELLDLIGIKKW